MAMAVAAEGGKIGGRCRKLVSRHERQESRFDGFVKKLVEL